MRLKQLSYKGRQKGSYGSQHRGKSGFHGFGKGKRDADTLAAQRNFESRSKRSQNQDLHKFAEIAPNITVYLNDPTHWDWRGVDDPNILAKINAVTKVAKKRPVHMIVKDEKAKKTHHFQIQKKKAEAKKEPENAKELAKAEVKEEISPLIEHKLPSEKEIYEKAIELYQKENFKAIHGEGLETAPTKGELAEEGLLQKAKLDLMTKGDTKNERQIFDYVEGLRSELNKIGFDVVPTEGFSVEDLKY